MMLAKGSTETEKIRLLIVDDHPIVRHGMSQLIATQSDMEVCGQAASVAEALELLGGAAAPDVAIVDLSLEDGSGLGLIKEIKVRCPEAKIIVSSIHDEKVYAARALKAGAVGYIEKRESISKIIEAVRHILEGKIYLSPTMANQLLRRAASGKPLNHDPLSLLSNRELEVFEMLGQGMTVQQIARRLGVSPKTVESHRKQIKDKLNLRNGAQLAHRAIIWVNDQS
jgi:DNA-binding NarL/FixJ family response regulator